MKLLSLKTCQECSSTFTTNRDAECCSRECRKKHWYKSKGRQYFREHYAANSDVKKRYNRVHVANLKAQCFTAYGSKCACPGCKEENLKFLTIDHVNNDGASHRAEIGRDTAALYRWLIANGFPEGFQVLCFNCNCGKNVNGGVCPHLAEGANHVN